MLRSDTDVGTFLKSLPESRVVTMLSGCNGCRNSARLEVRTSQLSTLPQYQESTSIALSLWSMVPSCRFRAHDHFILVLLELLVFVSSRRWRNVWSPYQGCTFVEGDQLRTTRALLRQLLDSQRLRAGTVDGTSSPDNTSSCAS